MSIERDVRTEICRRLRHNAERVYLPSSLHNQYCSYRLNGMCARCAFAIKQEFAVAGFPAEVVAGKYLFETKEYAPREYTHAWVESGDQIWDITATQFGLPEVHVAELPNPKYRKCNREHWAWDWTLWSPEQQPTKMNVLAIVTGPGTPHDPVCSAAGCLNQGCLRRGREIR